MPFSPKIIFYGTPEFAVPSLDILVKNGYEILAVVTVPDKPAGRGQRIIESPVKKYAMQHHLNVLQPVNLKDETFINTLRELSADLQVVVAFRMMPEVVWQMPTLGTFNLHASLLPQYRGAAPINWAVMNGEKETGVTTFFLQQEIDTGKIMYQEKTSIGEKETAGELHDRLMNIGAVLVLKTVDAISTNNYPLTEQDPSIHGTLHAAPKLNKTNYRIDKRKSSVEIENFVRGLNPFPAAITDFYNDSGVSIVVKIFQVVAEAASHQNKPGKIETDNKTFLKIYLSNGWIFIHELQVSGKNRMSVKDFLNGFKMTGNWEMQ